MESDEHPSIVPEALLWIDLIDDLGRCHPGLSEGDERTRREHPGIVTGCLERLSTEHVTSLRLRHRLCSKD
jgi:hypothetical protein